MKNNNFQQRFSLRRESKIWARGAFLLSGHKTAKILTATAASSRERGALGAAHQGKIRECQPLSKSDKFGSLFHFLSSHIRRTMYYFASQATAKRSSPYILAGHFASKVPEHAYNIAAYQPPLFRGKNEKTFWHGRLHCQHIWIIQFLTKTEESDLRLK